MRTFFAFFKLDLKSFFCIRNMIIILIFIIIAISVFQVGINTYQKKIDQKYLFQKLENEKIPNYLNYRLYGIYGILLIFEPNSHSVFFMNSAIVNELNAFMDSGERLNIYMQLIGSNMFKQKKFGFMDFSGVFFYLFTLLTCFYGFESFIYREYLKSITTLCGRKAGLFSIMGSRMVIIGLLIAILMFLAIIQSAINGIPLPIDYHLLVFYLQVLLLSVFFLYLGSALAKIKPMVVSVLFIFISWFFIIFALPAIVNGITENKADNIQTRYKLALKKLRKFSDFEKQAIKDNITYRPGDPLTDVVKKRVLSYIEKEVNEIYEMEMCMYRDMVRTAGDYHSFSMLFPSTYYISVTEELSSMGYSNLLDFYLHTINLKKKFVVFILEKIYFENFSPVVSFLKGDENVYRATGRLPATFLPGLFLHVFLIILLVLINYILHKNSLFEITGTAEEEDSNKQQDIKYKYGTHRVFKLSGKMLLHRLYNLFSGETRGLEKSGSQPVVYVEEKDISQSKFEESFLFICSPKSLPPDPSAGAFFQFLCDVTRCPRDKKEEISHQLKLDKQYKKKIKKLKRREKAALLLAMVKMTNRKVYLFHDIVRGMGRSFTEQFKDLLEKLSANGSLPVYLTGDSTLTEYKDGEFNGYFEKTDDWNRHVDEYRES